MARFAAIDIGTNAMRLRVVEADRPGTLLTSSTAWVELCSLRAPVRLGREVFLTGALTAGAISAATEALKQFREAMNEHKVETYRAVATSAVREAENAEVLVERAYREAGVHVEVIEGVEEARLVQLAIRRRLPLEGQCALLVDVGGGSTELTLLDHGETRASQSLPVGTVRLLEAFLEQGVAVDARHEELVEEFVERVLGEMSDEIRTSRPEVMVATGGTTDTLAQLCPRRMAEWPGIDVAQMGLLVRELSSLSAAERMRKFQLRVDRADTIIPAAHILLHVARPLMQTGIVAPGAGLKDGILEELVDKHYVRWNSTAEDASITRACLQLGRRYHFDEKHGILVSDLATRLFDDLRSLHRLGDRERLLLQASALLHDIGDFVRYEGHHKHSLYIIEHSDLMGVTPAERRIVANVARYHRKGLPELSHPNFRELGREERTLVRTLAGLLRLADALDREHRGKVTGVRGLVTKGRLRLEVTGAPDRELEVWTVARKSELFREVFDLDVEVVEAPPASRRPLGSAAAT
jgi:exopolyphosphatase / guanosine-5'-triphosphate,3'-diphosphate pyrophosphatase